ncbi:MAG: hypothetical protein HKM93_10340 [Desulfobacteraceae bacterium]|nr:hypothetical protein [Desulfobacteraceae bacterium]
MNATSIGVLIPSRMVVALVRIAEAGFEKSRMGKSINGTGGLLVKANQTDGRDAGD